MRTSVFSIYNASVSSEKQNGQVLIMVVLLMVIVLTVGLSLATRSLTNVRQSNEEDSSQRAFSAAEAGINVALKKNDDASDARFATDTSYTTIIKRVKPSELSVNEGRVLLKNEAVDIWLSEYPTFPTTWTGVLTLVFGDTSVGCPDLAAFEIAILSGSLTAPTVTHYAYDYCSRGNNFYTGVNQVNTTVDNKTYAYSITLPQITNGYLMRIIPIYKNATVAVRTPTANPLPIQGKVIESVGKSGSTQRKIVVVQGNPKLPIEMFPYSLFTPSSL